MRRSQWILFILLIVTVLARYQSKRQEPFSTPYLSPQTSQKHFVLAEGVRMELVVSEPDIREPVALVFDGDGSMYVAEMRSYMRDRAGSNALERCSVISRHVSTMKNGVYDRHTVFATNLVLPRMMLPLLDGILVCETGSDDLWLYSDRDRDGVSDEKRLFYKGGARGENIEHQSSGLVWAIDNWIYRTASRNRLRISGTNVITETIPPNGGQWGMTQDDYGKIWVINAGTEQGPLNFQTPLLYGSVDYPGQYSEGFAEVWPVPSLPDVQGGKNRLRADQTLNHFTATCGIEVCRGKAFPDDFQGNVLFAEPAGRLVRRAAVENAGGLTRLSNAYSQSEFIRSSDPNFRPVNLANGPDGALYMVDMYRGIIQESEWMKPGSYLDGVVQKYQLEANQGRGRIWRITHQSGRRTTDWPNLQQAGLHELAAQLANPNGWWRDTAQRLIVLRNDPAIVPELIAMAKSHSDHLARIHAIWCLEGIGALTAELVREKLLDAHPQVRIAAIRASESLYKSNDMSVVSPVCELAKDPDPNVQIQVLLTATLLKWPGFRELSESSKASPHSGVALTARRLLAPTRSFGDDFSLEEIRFLERGESIYRQLCFACHGTDGKGTPQGGSSGSTLAPSLYGSPRINGHKESMMAVLLHGLRGPVDGREYSAEMVPMGGNDDEWIASVGSFIRNSFGNSAPLILPGDVSDFRRMLRDRKEPWIEGEIRDREPIYLTGKPSWKATSSHNESTASMAIDGNPLSCFTTREAQVPGMWLQIELPSRTLISGVTLNALNWSRNQPKGFEITLSDDGKSWTPVGAGPGKTGIIHVYFTARKTRYIKITQTGSSTSRFWHVGELELMQPASRSWSDSKQAVR